MLEQKKQRLVQQLDRLEETRRRVERGVANARDALHQRDVQLADQLALKEDLQRLTRLCQRQWQLDLEVCSHVPLFVVFFFSDNRSFSWTAPGKQEPERRAVRLGDQLDQLTHQKGNLELTLCDLSKVSADGRSSTNRGRGRYEDAAD